VDWLCLSQGLTTLYWGIGSPLSDHESMLILPLSLHVSPPNPLISLGYHAIALAVAKRGLSTAPALVRPQQVKSHRLMPLGWDQHTGPIIHSLC
jgi:hypothetical protein